MLVPASGGLSSPPYAEASPAGLVPLLSCESVERRQPASSQLVAPPDGGTVPVLVGTRITPAPSPGSRDLWSRFNRPVKGTRRHSGPSVFARTLPQSQCASIPTAEGRRPTALSFPNWAKAIREARAFWCLRAKPGRDSVHRLSTNLQAPYTQTYPQPA